MMSDDLDAIKEDKNDESDPCLRQMLTIWLRQGTATRQALIAALQSKCVGYSKIVRSILVGNGDQMDESNDPSANAEVGSSSKEGFKCPLCGNCSLQEYLNGKCRAKDDTLSDLPFCCLDIDHLKQDEQITLYTKLMYETKCITKEYSNVVNALRTSLKKWDVDPNDIATFIFDVAQYDSLTKPLQSDSQFTTESRSIDTIMDYLQRNKYISFINFHILEDLISKYCIEDNALQNSLHSYQEKFRVFCKRSIFEVPQDAYGTLPTDGERLKFKVTNDFVASLPCNMKEDDDLHQEENRIVKKSSKSLKVSVSDTLTIQHRIAEALGPALNNVGHLVFLGALKGCVELTFSAPRSVMNSVKQMITNTDSSVPVESIVSANFTDLEAEGIHILSGPPGKPKAIKDMVTYDAITLEWSEPECKDFYPVQCYYVHYRSVADPPRRWTTIITENSNTQFEIGKLPQNKIPFIFKLQAVSEIGIGLESEYSDPIHLMKLPFVPMNGDYPSKPGKPRTLNVTHNSIELEWTKPEQGADSITFYTILYHSMRDYHIYWIESKYVTTEEQVTVSQLSESTKYLFQVQPVCEGNVGLVSDISDPIKTKVKMPGKPGIPKDSNITHDSVLLQWTKPEQAAHNVTSYTIFYSSITATNNEWRKYQTVTSEEVLVSQLSDNSVYYFKIRTDSDTDNNDAEIESNISDCTCIRTNMIIPSKPGKPRALEITHNSVKLEWTKPENGVHNITSNIIFYRSASDPTDHWNQQRVEASETDFHITQLSEKTIYYFRICSECRVGWGPMSDTSEPVMTKMILPSKPGKPRALEITHNSVKLEWTKPENGVHNITSNIIFYRSASDPTDHWNQQRVEASETDFHITQLSEKTIYYFRICSECRVGWGPMSDTSEPVMTKMILPSKPGKPRALEITHNSVKLEWTKPENGVHNITSNIIFYRSASDPTDHWNQQRVEASETDFHITQLSEKTIYYFRICSECRVGWGPMSDTSEPVMTKMILPSKPGKPRALEITHNSVELEWTKPENGAHNIISYTALYRSICDPPEEWLKQAANTAERLLVTKLLENTIYFFKIRPECVAGNGPESDVSEPIETKIILPSKPGKPRALEITHNSVKLEWTKPENGAHNIISYTVLYCSISDPPKEWLEHTAVMTEKVHLSQLVESTSYHFKVRAECEVGYGPESDISEPVETNLMIPGKPGKPKALEVTENSINLEWSKPDYGAHNVISYIVLYQSKAAKTWKKQKVPSTYQSVFISPLSDYTPYFFIIRPEYAPNKFGLDSDVSNPIQTKMIVPDKPTNFKVSSVSHNSVQLKWRKPMKGAHNVNSYNVMYHSPEHPWVWKKISPTQDGAFIQGLSEGTTYYFKLQADCKAGLKFETDKLLVRTNRQIRARLQAITDL